MMSHRPARARVPVCRLIGFGLAAYVCLYIALSRYSRGLVAKYGIEGFYYVPADPETIARNRTLESLNEYLSVLFYPLWLVDFHLLGGPPMSVPPLMELSKLPCAGHPGDMLRRGEGLGGAHTFV